MPRYEFLCPGCGARTERYRKVGDYTSPECPCGSEPELAVSLPSMHVWSGERRFPNLSPKPYHDGTETFASKAAYESHLKANHLAEIDHGGVRKVKTGNRVVGTWR